jgi:phosphoribosylaminoimidazole carboxylase PurE protein
MEFSEEREVRLGEHRFVRGGAESHEDRSAGLTPQSQVEAIVGDFAEQLPPVAIIVATREERTSMEECGRELTNRGIDHDIYELSPHRNGAVLTRFVELAAMRGIRVIIATGGTVPSLPSMVASYTDVPVIGVPLSAGPLGGLDTLLATAQAAPGTPVACMCIDGIRNSAIFAAHVLTSIPLPPR